MDKYQRLAIRSVDPKVAADLAAIAQNKNQTLSAFLRPHLRKIRDSYPEDMRVSPKDKKKNG